MKHLTVLVAIAASFSTPLFSQTKRDLGSHEHGVASLNIALDQSTIFLELETPWDNLVGFEHEPSTDEQHALIDNALALLNQPEQLFSFDGGGCNASETAIQSSMGEHAGEGEHHGDEHADEHADGHDDEHADGHADGHADEHADGHDDEHADEHADGHDDEGGSHSELLATYSFTCDDVSKLSGIDVDLLTLWDGFEALDVKLIGPGGQALQELSASQISVDTTQVQ